LTQILFQLQIQLLSDNFGLQFSPALASDTTEYICLVNDRHIPEAIVDLLVQGEYYNKIQEKTFLVFRLQFYIFVKIKSID